MAVTRPLKEGSVPTYQQKVALGFPDILASEMDADLDTIYAAWNGGPPDGSVTSASLGVGVVGTRELADNLPGTILASGQITARELADGGITWVKHGDQTYARIYRTSGFPSIANATATALTFDVVGVNTGGLYSAAAPDRFTVQQTGYYVVGGSIEFAASAGGSRRLLLLALNAANVAGSEAMPSATATRLLEVTTGTLVLAGQAFQLLVYQDSGGPLSIVTATSLYPNFWIARVG